MRLRIGVLSLCLQDDGGRRNGGGRENGAHVKICGGERAHFLHTSQKYATSCINTTQNLNTKKCKLKCLRDLHIRSHTRYERCQRAAQTRARADRRLQARAFSLFATNYETRAQNFG